MHNDTRNQPLDELLEAVGRDQVTWQPENPGDQIAGTVVELTELDTEYGRAPVVVVLEPSGREVRVLGFGAVLQRAIYTSSVQPGDLFAARYLGKTQGKTGRPYSDYRVVVRNGDGTPKRSNDQAVAKPRPVDDLVDQLEPLPSAPQDEEPW
jgi:hypothetical protein